MDPDANLHYALELAKRIIMCVDEGEPIDDGDALGLSECLLNLDDWLVKKGAIPKRWKR